MGLWEGHEHMEILGLQTAAQIAFFATGLLVPCSHMPDEHENLFRRVPNDRVL